MVATQAVVLMLEPNSMEMSGRAMLTIDELRTAIIMPAATVTSTSQRYCGWDLILWLRLADMR